eukprot:7670598-Lingulodinium_polyedra.AAC.1
MTSTRASCGVRSSIPRNVPFPLRSRSHALPAGRAWGAAMPSRSILCRLCSAAPASSSPSSAK